MALSGFQVASEHWQMQRHHREPEQWEQGMWNPACTWDNPSDMILVLALRFNTHILHLEKCGYDFLDSSQEIPS